MSGQALGGGRIQELDTWRMEEGGRYRILEDNIEGTAGGTGGAREEGYPLQWVSRQVGCVLWYGRFPVHIVPDKRGAYACRHRSTESVISLEESCIVSS